MSTRHVQLSSDGSLHAVIIGGVDLSAGLRGATLTLETGKLPALTLDPVIFHLDGADIGEARVIVTDHAAQALVALGWTPPPDGDRHTK